MFELGGSKVNRLGDVMRRYVGKGFIKDPSTLVIHS
jgi:hypothetical protein